MRKGKEEVVEEGDGNLGRDERQMETSRQEDREGMQQTEGLRQRQRNGPRQFFM